MDNNKICIPFTPPHTMSGMPEQTPILLAFSGGADSRALLHLLADYCKKSNTPLYAAHVNHGIRGDDALRDRDFCVRTAASYGIECFVLDANVPKLASEHKESLETEARHIRYDFFTSLMNEHNIPLLATAHNADDCLETLIFNIARGSGLHGICSIPPTRPLGNGLIIRPILKAPKKDITQFCIDNNLEFVTDSTNEDTAYSRNLIRHKIIPALEIINQGVRENASRLNSAARDACDFIDSCANEFLKNNSDGNIPAEKLNSLPSAVKQRVLSSLTENASGIVPEEVHINALSELVAKSTPHSSLSLPGKIRAIIINGNLTFKKDPRKKEIPENFTVRLAEGINLIPGGAIVLSSTGHNIDIPDNMFLYDSVTLHPSTSPIVVRNLSEGDTIRCCGMTKKVRKLLSEKKLPLNERYIHPMVCNHDEILWIPKTAVKEGAESHDNGILLSYYKLLFLQ